jgi:hypothetical protein
MANRMDSMFSASSSDSGVFLLDPKERALIEAAAEGLEDADEGTAHSRFLEIARQLPKVRLDKVMAIREQIAAGTYVTDEKMNATVDALLRALRG